MDRKEQARLVNLHLIYECCLDKASYCEVKKLNRGRYSVVAYDATNNPITVFILSPAGEHPDTNEFPL